MKARKQALAIECLEQRRVFASGDIDLSFGTQGRVTTEFADSQTWGTTANAVIVDSSNRTLAAGAGTLARLLPNGDLDNSFGFGGQVAFPHYARALALQSNGQIIVAGGTDKNYSTDFIVARYTTDGQLDTSFGTSGMVSIDFGSNAETANALLVDENDRIVAAGGSDSSMAAVRLLANGALDDSFAREGKFVQLFHRSDTAFALAAYPGGRIVMAGTSWIDFAYNRIDYDMSMVRLNENGSIDNSFSNDGVATVNFTNSTFSRDQGRGLAVQPDGRILITGAAYGNFTNYFGLARLLPNGSLDETFATGGKRLLQASNEVAAGQVLLPGDGTIVVTNSSSLLRFDSQGNLDTSFDGDGVVGALGSVNAAALAVDGAIVVAGSFSGAIGIRRFLSTGAADTTFSSDGRVTVATGPSVDTVGQSIAQSDGKVIAVGSSQRGFAVARYLTNGALDPSFSGDGLAVFTFDVDSEAHASSVALQADGKIVMAGSVIRTASGFANADFALLRLNTDGTLDTTFSDDGMQTTEVGGYDQAHGVLIQPDGKIVLGGVSGNGVATLARYNANGTLDTRFNGDGIAPMQTQNSRFSRIALQPDGMILAAGNVLASNSFIYPSTLMVARFRSNGFLDTTFGAGGKMVDPSSPQRAADDIALQPNGQFVVVGDAVTRFGATGANYDIAVSRYNADGTPDGLFRTIVVPQTEPSLNDDFSSAGVSSYGSSVLVQSSGRIVISGHAGSRTFIARLNNDGTRDTSFAGDGVQTFGTTGSKLTAANVVQASSGRLILVGTSERFHFDQTDRDFTLLAVRDQTESPHATSVVLSASGNIELSDLWSRGNRFEVAITIEGIRITDTTGDSNALMRVVGLPGVSGDGTREVFIPHAATNGKPIIINGNQGDDYVAITTTIDVPANVITFRGGSGDDTFSLAGLARKQDFILTTASSGGVSVSGVKPFVFTGVDQLIGGNLEDTFRLVFTGAPERLRIDGGGSSGDSLSINADANMLFSPEIPQNKQRLIVETTVRQEFSVRGIEHANLVGGSGDNRIDASQFRGSTKIIGHGGNDELYGSRGRSSLYGEDGDDQLFSGLDADNLFGGNGNDLLVGSDGPDTLSGGAGYDILVGGFGPDVLIGGTDDDLLIGDYCTALVANREITARQAIMAAWYANVSLSNKIHLLSNVGVGVDNSVKLHMGTTIFNDFNDDGLIDDLAQSWFFDGGNLH